MNTVEEMVHMADIGAGTVMMPPVIVRPHLLNGRLVELDVTPPQAQMEFHALYREDGLSSMCKEICDLVRTSVQERLTQMQRA